MCLAVLETLTFFFFFLSLQECNILMDKGKNIFKKVSNKCSFVLQGKVQKRCSRTVRMSVLCNNGPYLILVCNVKY